MEPTMKLIKKVKYKNWNCNLYQDKYVNGRIALLLIDADDGEPVSTCTVNTDDDPNLVLIKDYSENEGMLAFLVNEGVVKDTGKRVASGYITIPIVEILQ
jgi:hypothetical protein